MYGAGRQLCDNLKGQAEERGSQASDWLALPNVHQHSLLAGENAKGRREGHKA